MIDLIQVELVIQMMDDTARVLSNDRSMNGEAATNYNQTAWQNIAAGTRNFVCTASVKIHYNLQSSSNRDIQPIDVYKIHFLLMMMMIVRGTNKYVEDTAAVKPVTLPSKLNEKKPVTSKDIRQFFGFLS